MTYSQLDIGDVLKAHKSTIDEMVEKPNHLSTTWLRSKNWATIVFADRIDIQLAKSLSKAADTMGIGEVIACSIELNEQPVSFRVPISVSALTGFDRDYSLSNFILFPATVQFAILKEAGFYVVVAGPKDFVENVAGRTFETARREFDADYANLESWPEKTRTILKEVSNRYAKFNG